VDELPVVHQEVELGALEVDPLAGDEAAVGPVREEVGAGGADVFTGREGTGVQGVGLGLVEVLPGLGQEMEKEQEVHSGCRGPKEEGVEGMEPAVEAAWGGDVGEEVQVFGENQGLGVLAAQFHGGKDGQGEDDAGGDLGLGVIAVACCREGIVYNAKGRCDTGKHGGHYFFSSLGRWQLRLLFYNPHIDTKRHSKRNYTRKPRKIAPLKPGLCGIRFCSGG
jgi:hypothetical protein